MAIGLLNLDEDFFKRQQGTASDMNALRDVVGAVGERMAEKRGLQQQAPQLVQPQQNRMVPIVEQEPNPLLVVNPGPRGIISEPGRQYRPMDMLEMVNAGREDIIAQGTTYPQGQTTRFNAGQVSAPIYEMDTSGIAPIAPEVQAIKAVENEENRSGSGNEQSTFLKRLYANLKDDPRAASMFFADAAQAFNTLRLKPDAGLNTAMEKRKERITDYRKSVGIAARTVETLKSLGADDPNAAIAARLIESNPESAKEILKQYVQKRFEKKASRQASGVQIDPETGQIYNVVFDPNTNQVTRQNVEGAFAETETAKLLRESEQEQVNNDIKAAFEQGQDVFKKAGGINEQISLLDQALAAVEAGASTGVIRNMLPALNSATAQLRAVANQLGIEIINSATFGALSEKELGLALSTGLDTSLKGPELIKHIEEKIAARKKLRDQLFKDAKRLTQPGARFSDYVAEREAQYGESKNQFVVNYAAPGALDLPSELQRSMSEEEINIFYLWPEQKQRQFLAAE